jgi:hypothetical protein
MIQKGVQARTCRAGEYWEWNCLPVLFPARNVSDMSGPKLTRGLHAHSIYLALTSMSLCSLGRVGLSFEPSLT